MHTLFQDIRYALRQLQKSPGFTAIAIASLALAIGANTTIFSFANQMLYARLGLPNPTQLRLFTITGDDHMAVHSMWGSSSGDNGKRIMTSISLPVYQQLRKQNTVLGDLFASKQLPNLSVTANGSAQVATAELVTGNFYAQAELKPELGRGILPADDGAPGTGTVAVLSDAFWHKNFGGSPDVLGKTVAVNNIPFTIVGVNPPNFTAPESPVGAAPELFVPLSMISILHPATGFTDTSSPDLWWLQVMARTKSGVSDATAEAALNVQLAAAVRATMKVKKDDTMPRLLLADGSRGDTMPLAELAKPLYILLGLAALVLLLACANIANLMLARASARQREMSVRMALGAPRGRILQQVLTESILLSFLGGVAGICLGYLGRNIIPTYLMETSWDGGHVTVPFDWRVFAYTSAITLATGILFGIFPAWRSTRADINTALKEGSRSATRRRKAWSGKAIVGFQVALSTLLVMSAAFFIRTIVNLNSINPGFDAHNLLLFQVNPPSNRYPSPKDTILDHRLEQSFAAIPGVQSVTAANVPLVAENMWNSGFHVEGQNSSPFSDKKDMRNYPDLDDVGNTFFSTMHIPIVAGRAFNDQDTETSVPVSVVNQTLAHEFFPNSNPIGQRFRMDSEGPGSKWITIIGICADTRYNNLRDEPPAIHFDLYRQATDIGSLDFIVRSSLPAAALVPSLRNAAKQIDPDLPMNEFRTQQQQIDAVMQQERMFASLTAGFGILALALACVGVYGIMAYTVSQRTNEIGIRLALGAAREQVRAMVLRETAWLAAAGVVIGLAATLALTRIIKSMLYGLKPYDPATLAGSILVLLVVAFIAGWIPAHRASRADPIEALRNE
jgi:predicted permease